MIKTFLGDERLLAFTEDELAALLCRIGNRGQETFRDEAERRIPLVPFTVEAAIKVIRDEPYFQKRRVETTNVKRNMPGEAVEVADYGGRR